MVVSFFFQTDMDMVCCMNPMDDSRELISYFQVDYAAICEQLKESGLEHADNSTLNKEDLARKNELLVAKRDSYAAMKAHIAELSRLKSENDTAESSNSQSSGKRTFSEVSDKTNETEKIRRTR